MIACDLHDYVEIACIYKMLLILRLKSGDIIQGVALDTARNELAEECIKVRQGTVDSLVVLDSIMTMEAKKKNPHFDLVNFCSKSF